MIFGLEGEVSCGGGGGALAGVVERLVLLDGPGVVSRASGSFSGDPSMETRPLADLRSIYENETEETRRDGNLALPLLKF